ncbi:hypothetical protein TIFTF001_052355, partial [Ficus carica]
MEQADEVKLDVAEHKTLASAALDVESPMADQRQLVSEGDEETAVEGRIPLCSAMMSSEDCFGIFH